MCPDFWRLALTEVQVRPSVLNEVLEVAVNLVIHRDCWRLHLEVLRHVGLVKAAGQGFFLADGSVVI